MSLEVSPACFRLWVPSCIFTYQVDHSGITVLDENTCRTSNFWIVFLYMMWAVAAVISSLDWFGTSRMVAVGVCWGWNLTWGYHLEHFGPPPCGLSRRLAQASLEVLQFQDNHTSSPWWLDPRSGVIMDGMTLFRQPYGSSPRISLGKESQSSMRH